jgi:glucose-fructose oxidoreductase
MAVTAKDCEQMIQAAKKARVRLMVAYRLHFERATLEAIKIARSGQLGGVRFFSSDFSMQVSEDNIRLQRKHGGGPLFDIGIYCINAARYCLGEEPIAVWATATRSRDRRFREIDETVFGAMRFGDEKLASFTCSFGSADRSTFTLAGTKGSLTLDPAYEYAEGLSLVVRSGGRERRRDFAKRDQFAAELTYFSDCIINGHDPEPSGKEGLIDVRIIESMMRSIKTGRWVAINVPKRRHRPSMRQEKRMPAVPREPKLIDAEAAAQ